MAKKDRGKDTERDWKPWYIGTRVDIPERKGKLRNLFAERGMMPKPKRTCDCAQSERGAAGSRVTGA